MSKAESSGKMGLAAGVSLIVGACVGSAIFSISGVTIFYAGPSAILSWGIAAVIFAFYGTVVSKLAIRYPQSGGVYVFPEKAIGGTKGKILAFFSAWGYIISNIIAIAFSAIYLGMYLEAGFPELEESFLPGFLAVVIGSWIVAAGGKRVGWIQTVLVIAVSSVMVFYSAFAFFGGGFDAGRFHGFFNSGAHGATGFIDAIPLAMVAYGGSVAVAFMASEVRSPQRDIPRFLIFGLGFVAILYIMLITATVGTLPIESVSGDESLMYMPLFATISCGGLSAYPWMARIVSVCVCIALLSTIIALMRINSGAMQAAFGTKQSSNSVMTGIVCLALVLIPEYTEEMINLGAVLNIVSMSVTCLALFFSQRKYAGLSFGTLLVLWACYIPEIARGNWHMWAFTVLIYALAAAALLLSRSRFKK